MIIGEYLYPTKDLLGINTQTVLGFNKNIADSPHNYTTMDFSETFSEYDFPNIFVGTSFATNNEPIIRLIRHHKGDHTPDLITDTLYKGIQTQKTCLGTTVYTEDGEVGAFLSIQGTYGSMYDALPHLSGISAEDEGQCFEKFNEIVPVTFIRGAYTYFTDIVNGSCDQFFRKEDILKYLYILDKRLFRDLVEGVSDFSRIRDEHTNHLLSIDKFSHELERLDIPTRDDSSHMLLAEGSDVEYNDIFHFEDTALNFIECFTTDFDVSFMITELTTNYREAPMGSRLIESRYDYFPNFKENRSSQKRRLAYLASEAYREYLVRFNYPDDIHHIFDGMSSKSIDDRERSFITIKRSFSNHASITVTDYVNKRRYTHIFDLTACIIASLGAGVSVR